MNSSISSSDRPLDRSEFIDQNIIIRPKPCNFYDPDKLKLDGTLPSYCLIRPFDLKSQSDWYSESWICFPEYPFTIGLKYPFPSFFNEFFSVTGLCYAQATPTIWRTLSVIQRIKDSYGLAFDIPELSCLFNLHNSGSGFFVLDPKPSHELSVFNTFEIDSNWESRFFFVFRDSLPNSDLIHSSWITEVNLAELALPHQNSKSLIKTFLEIPEEERTFRYPKTSSLSQMPKATKKGCQKPSTYFSLEDIDNELLLDEKKIKKSNKPCSEMLHSIMRGKKPKYTPAPKQSLSDFDQSFEFFYQGMEHASKCYLEKLKVIEAMDEIISIKNKTAQDNADEIGKLKKRIEGFEVEMMQAEQKWSAKAEKETAISVLEARIAMANEAMLPNFNASSWRNDIWKDRLTILKGQGSWKS